MTTMTNDQMLALLSKLQAENESLKAQAVAKISLKVGESGTVCLYHGARYPVALYRSQWERILPFLRSGKVEEFIAANATLLADKSDKK